MKNIFLKFKYVNILAIVTLALLVVVNIGYPCFWESFLGFIANTLFIGILTSYIFYYIVVYLPEKRKKDVIKNFYKKQFKDFKTQVIIILLRNLPNIPADDQDSFKIKLTDISNFRVFFKTFPEGSPFQDRWGKVADGLQENIHDIKEIFIEFEVLEKETKYILSNLDIHNEEIFDFLKRISRMTYNFRDFDPEKDDVKSLMSFLWSIFAGWSRITGYPEEDIFEVILRDL